MVSKSVDLENDVAATGSSGQANVLDDATHNEQSSWHEDCGGDDEGASPSSFCTFAVSGSGSSFFQPIFICHDCFMEETSGVKDGSSSPSSPLCICQACAENCHEDHDVEFIGMGPCYCDCNHIGSCHILPESQREATKLFGQQAGRILSSEHHRLLESNQEQQEQPKVESSNLPFQEVYEVPELLSHEVRSGLVLQAQELIRHSKETFWLDMDIVRNVQDLCALERLAWKIYQRHMSYYEAMFPVEDRGGGAEWWVQIKDLQSAVGNQNSAIDLHYDKDEALAEVFGLGLFPTLSTVTYLTTSASLAFNPTLVLDHTYVQGEGDMIDNMLVSMPTLGKHLVFDGRLLHGAPAHEALRSQPPTDNIQKDECSPIRVTFLVNVWNQRPAKVEQLPTDIRTVLLKTASGTACAQTFDGDTLVMNKKDISVIELYSPCDLPEHLQHRIELPFVSKGATSGDQLGRQSRYEKESNESDVDVSAEISEDDDDDAEMVVITFPPPPMICSVNDTLLMKFGPGLQAYLDYPNRRDALENSNTPQESAYV